MLNVVDVEKKQLFIVGASGHGRVIQALAEEKDIYGKVCFLDDDVNVQREAGVLGGKEYALKFRDNAEVVVGIGNAGIRKKIIEYYEKNQMYIASLVHTFSWIASDVVLGVGSVVMAGAVIQPGCKVGKGVVINTSTSIDHECKIGNYCHISVGSHLAGNVCVGDNTWIGAGAVINNNVSICADVTIGSGAVVVKDITESGTYVGVPARKIS